MVPPMPLTDAEIRRADPREKPWKLFDGGGLHLLITPGGAKLWRLKYRHRGKELQAAFGPYPTVTLREARQKRDDFKRALLTGEDPMAPKRGRSFEDVAREYIEKQAKRLKPRYRADALRRLELNIFPDLGSQPIGTIEPPDLLQTLRRIEARGAHEQAARVRALCSQVFRFGIASGYCKRDPATDLKGALTPHKTVHHPALSADDLKELLAKIKASDDEKPVTRLGLLVLAHTAVRTSELIAAEWPEIKENQWIIPGARMKMGLPHIVPLSRQSRALFDELRELNGNSRFIFASPNNVDKHISNNTLLFALYRLGYRSRMTGHGFRSCFSTIANEEREKKTHAFGTEVIERQLDHCERNAIKAAYNRAEHIEARADLMQFYSDFIEGLIASGPPYRIGDFTRLKAERMTARRGHS
jgi:integrase